MYFEELKQILNSNTKTIATEVTNTFLWVELPSYIAVLSGIVSSLYRIKLIGWLTLISGLVIMYPNLLVTSSAITSFGGLLYLVTGIIILSNKAT